MCDGRLPTLIVGLLLSASAGAAEPIPLDDGDPQSYFGLALDGAGDVDADGYADVVIGGYAAGKDHVGAAYVYRGGAGGLDPTPAVTLTGEAREDAFGIAVAGAGDIDGDGYADVAIGGRPARGAVPGRLYVYAGSAEGLEATPVTLLESSGTETDYGTTVVGLGDLDGDGFGEVLVGAPLGGASAQGMVFLYRGSSAGLTPSLDLTGDLANGGFGVAAAAPGDLDGDGLPEVVVGATPGQKPTLPYVYVYAGSEGGLDPSAAVVLTNGERDSHFGTSVSGAGDLDADGYRDLLVGSDGSASGAGCVYVYPGGPGGPDEARVQVLVSDDDASLFFGHSVAGVGDVDGDGYADVAVGDEGWADYTGRAILLLGSPTGLSSSPGFAVAGTHPGAWFGHAVAPAHDTNGDGLADVLMGADVFDGYAMVWSGQRRDEPGDTAADTAGETAGETASDTSGETAPTDTSPGETAAADADSASDSAADTTAPPVGCSGCAAARPPLLPAALPAFLLPLARRSPRRSPRLRRSPR